MNRWFISATFVLTIFSKVNLSIISSCTPACSVGAFLSIDEYKLGPLIHHDHVYVEIRKGMYSLPQAGKIANDRLTKFLAPYGYAPVPLTAGLWRHDTRDITFTLVVDDFGVKYTDVADANHLMSALKDQYKVSEDWTGAKYCGLTLDWDYARRTCDISIPGYIERALQRFAHPQPTRPQHSPHA